MTGPLWPLSGGLFTLSLEVKGSFSVAAMKVCDATVCTNFEKILFSKNSQVLCIRVLKCQTSCFLFARKN